MLVDGSTVDGGRWCGIERLKSHLASLDLLREKRVEDWTSFSALAKLNLSLGLDDPGIPENLRRVWLGVHRSEFHRDALTK